MILQKKLHRPVAFFILPVFALANTAIVIGARSQEIFSTNYSIGILLGLVVGKALGIFSFCMLAIKLGICKLPDELKKIHILGVGFLGGIGFTMSVFITMLAFEDENIINNTKLIIIISSLLAGTIGYTILKICLRQDVLDES